MRKLKQQLNWQLSTLKGPLRGWKLFWYFRKLHLQRLFEYRADFFFWSFISLMWTGFNFFFLSLLINVNQQIAGWTPTELYILMGVFTILDALTWSFFYPNMREYTDAIFNGTLGQHLVRPANPLFILTTHFNSYNNLPRLLIGLSVVILGVRRLPVAPSMGSVVGFILLSAVGAIFIYTLWFVVATITFWVEKLNNANEVVPALRRLYQFPRQIYTGLMGTVVTLIIPVALVTTTPTEVLLGRGQLDWIVYFVLFTTGLVFFARWFFYRSLKKYSSVGG